MAYPFDDGIMSMNSAAPGGGVAPSISPTGPTFADVMARINAPMAGGDTFQKGLDMAKPGGMQPEIQQVLDTILKNRDYAANQGMSAAQALASRRGLAGSSIEQFGTQSANEAATRASQDSISNVLLENARRNQQLQDTSAQAYFTRASQEGQAALQKALTGAQLTSDEVASIRNMVFANQQLKLQSDLGYQGLDVARGNINANRDIANQEQRNALLGTGANILSPYILPHLFGTPGMGGTAGTGGGIFPGLFGGGAAAGTMTGAATPGVTAASSLFPAGLGTVGTGAGAGMGMIPALGMAGLGIAGYQSLSDKGKSLVAPLVNPIKTVSTITNAVKNVFPF